MLLHWQHLEKPQKEGIKTGGSYLLQDLVASFGAQWDDEAIQSRDKSPSQRRARHWAAAASSWEQQLVSPTFFEDVKMSLKRMIRMVILMTMRKKYGWKKLMHTMATTMNGMRTFHKMTSIWSNNLDLWKGQTFAPTEMVNASSGMKSAARNCMDTRKLVAQVKISTRILSCGWSGAFDGLQSMTPRASAGTKAWSKTRGREKCKSKG